MLADSATPQSASRLALVQSGLATIPEAAEYMRSSHRHIYTLFDQGLPSIKFAKRRLIPWAALHEWAAQHLAGG